MHVITSPKPNKSHVAKEERSSIPNHSLTVKKEPGPIPSNSLTVKEEPLTGKYMGIFCYATNK